MEDRITINGIEYVRADDANKQAQEVDGMPYVIVRSDKAGVFAGYLARRDGQEADVRNVQSIIYDLHQQIADRDRRLEDAYSKLRAQRQLLYRLEAVNADLRQQNAHLLDQPLVILNGDAFIGQRSVSRPCPN